MDLRECKLSSRALIPLVLALPINRGLTPAERATLAARVGIKTKPEPGDGGSGCDL